MGHYHLEVIMPPTDNVKAALEQILMPFDENGDRELYSIQHTFWDYWTIGGRYSGSKIAQQYDIGLFNRRLSEAKITVSGLQMGKPTLNPASQREQVEALWRETFPDAKITCPVFDYYNGGDGDVATLGETTRLTQCYRVIIAGPSHDKTVLAAHLMMETSYWNGVSHNSSGWDGKLDSALYAWSNELASYREDWQEGRTPTDDWLVVTVDYHS